MYPLAKDLNIPLSYLLYWSSDSFQNFLKSGVLDDVQEVAGNRRRRTIQFSTHDMLQPPSICGNVTRDQGLEFLRRTPKEGFEEFCDMFRAWSKTSGWWESGRNQSRLVDWSLRDTWRVEMGLARINPFLLAADDVSILLLRRKGHFGFNGKNLNPEEGYRFAEPEEVPGDHISFTLGTAGILTFSEQRKRWILFTSSVVREEITDMTQFCHNYVFYMAYIKL